MVARRQYKTLLIINNLDMKLIFLSYLIFQYSLYSQDSIGVNRLINNMDYNFSFDTLMSEYYDKLKISLNDKNDELIDRIKAEMVNNKKNIFENAIIPTIYKNISSNELDTLNNLLESAQGKLLIYKQRQLQRELLLVIDKLSTEITNNLVNRINNENKLKIKHNLETKGIDCKDLKEGNFMFQNEDNTIVKIERTKKFQKDIYPHKINTHKIKWLDDCTYQLEFVKSEAISPEKKFSIFKVFYNDNKKYKFIVKYYDDPNWEDGVAEIIKINSN